MRLVIQRVTKASVHIDKKTYSEINTGLLVLIGIEHDDLKADADYLASKCCNLRVFDDQDVVSQFTLHASTKKGNRPSYIKAAKHNTAVPLYDYFIEKMNIAIDHQVKTGVFGADMYIEMVNHGPVTILIDSKNKE